MGVAVGVGRGVCVGVGVAVPFGATVAVAGAVSVVAIGVAVSVARISVLTVAVGLADPARWRGVAPPKNASVPTIGVISAMTAPAIASARGRRHGRGGGGCSCGTRLPVSGAEMGREGR